MANNFGCCSFIILKIVDFEVDKNILWNTQNAPDRTIFIKFSRGNMALEHRPPPCTSMNLHRYRAT